MVKYYVMSIWDVGLLASETGAILENHRWKMIKLFYKNCIVLHKECTRFDQSFFQNGFS